VVPTSLFSLLSFFHFYPKAEFSTPFDCFRLFDMCFYFFVNPLALGHTASTSQKQASLLAQTLAKIFLSF